MKPKSDNLFHFTKTLEVIKKILKYGICPRYSIEDNEWFGLDDNKYLAFPMSCFCDIPLSRISEHTDFYGEYGIGLTKDWGMKNGLNPVVYSPLNGNMQELMKYLFGLHMDDEDSLNELNTHSYKLWSLLKPTLGKMLISGEFIEKEFYQENEWRYVPPIEKIITFEDEKDLKNFNVGSDKNREEVNTDVEAYKLQISPDDIRYIFVKSDNDIPSLVDFINVEMGQYPLNDLKILQSRIVSLNTLRRDL